MKENQTEARNGHPAPKWAALVTDELFPMPRQKLASRDILDQASISREFVLVRDHGSPNDVILEDDALVDLGQGNVFNVLKRCDAHARNACVEPAKLAYVCEDAWKVTLATNQTDHSLKRLFGLPEDTKLIRDFESPNDEPIAPGSAIHFADGPVFRAQQGCGAIANKEITIVVNGRQKTVSQNHLSYEEVVKLAFGNVDEKTICTVTYSNGPCDKPEGKMVQGDVVNIKCGEIFNVTPTKKS